MNNIKNLVINPFSIITPENKNETDATLVVDPPTPLSEVSNRFITDEKFCLNEIQKEQEMYHDGNSLQITSRDDSYRFLLHMMQRNNVYISPVLTDLTRVII